MATIRLNTIPNLVRDDIYAVLVDRGTMTSFHWMFYVPNAQDQGYRFHLVNTRPIGSANTVDWYYDSGPWSPASSTSSAVYCRIGSLSTIPCDIATLDSYFRQINTRICPQKQAEQERGRCGCRVWFKEAVRVLHDSAAGFIVNCPNEDMLEIELKKFAFAAAIQHVKAYQISEVST
ncbi:hypothetical protein FA15DRAFT_707452 [Coprinopsis marcescibilis]|uniref:Uncharacterized protein n=1 Tax=Coprinopsis marcescibilis TaxID=230819 RepID=A0A5C3KLM9_COPMA|nr:hypothetical protein FA15DRAFT_707452 [Coprinopsis marcescibilis]